MEIQLKISASLSDSFIDNYQRKYFNPNFQQEDINSQLLERVDLQREIASDIVDSIRKERPRELFELLSPLYQEVRNFDNSGLLQISISEEEEVMYEKILADIENIIVNNLQTDEAYRTEISKEIIAATRN